MNKILTADDDSKQRDVFSNILKKEGFLPIEAINGKHAVEVFIKEKPDTVLLDLKMPDMDGIQAMQEIKKIEPKMPVIIITGFGDIETAVESIKLGAYDFLVKPPPNDRLVFTVKRAVEKWELEKDVKRLDTAMDMSLEWLLGKSEAIKKVIKQICHVVQSNFSIIIEGETGTGKTIVAHTIHNLSKMAKCPFITVDMGAIPDTLIESELFGYKKGAFTGAEKDKKGLFELANNGTLFIDEIQNMNPHIQSKLLRVVEEKKFFPLGSTSCVDINVRIIAAGNMNIKQAVKEKRLREDLFFRLGEFIITLPPLRERVEDITFFAQSFFIEANRELNKHIQGLSEDTLNLLKRYPWSGNVRELKNVIRRAVLLCSSNVIEPEHIEFLIEDESNRMNNFSLLPLRELSAMAVNDVEKNAIINTLELTKGNKSKAASILQIDYKTIITKIRKYNISQKNFLRLS